MTSFADKLLALVGKTPGATDRDLADILLGKGKHPSQVNQEARLLESRGILVRRRREDGLIGNYPGDHPVTASPHTPTPVIKRTLERLSEDEIKEALATWLMSRKWKVSVMWGNARGVDIDAKRDGARGEPGETKRSWRRCVASLTARHSTSGRCRNSTRKRSTSERHPSRSPPCAGWLAATWRRCGS